MDPIFFKAFHNPRHDPILLEILTLCEFHLNIMMRNAKMVNHPDNMLYKIHLFQMLPREIDRDAYVLFPSFFS